MYLNCDMQQRFWLAYFYRPAYLSNACWQHDENMWKQTERKKKVVHSTCKLKIIDVKVDVKEMFGMKKYWPKCILSSEICEIM